MNFPALFIVALFGVAVAPSSVQAPFALSLQLIPSKSGPPVFGSATVGSRNEKARPRVQVSAGELLRVQLKVTREIAPPTEDVLVHYFVVREETVGAQRTPDLEPERVLVEGAATMDFAQKDDLQATFSFRIHQPGAYLLRVECEDPKSDDLGPPFSALDLEAK